MDHSTPFNGDLTLKELKTVISGLGSASKATGEDPISYHLIRRFPESMIEILLEFYQTCRESGTIPVAWKDALVIAIPKEGKPYCSNSAPRQSVRETGQKQTAVPPRETGHTSSMPGRFPRRSKLHGACRKALQTCQNKSLRAAVRLSPPSLTLREPLTQSGTPSSLTRCRLWASRADCTNSCKRSWTPGRWQ